MKTRRLPLNLDWNKSTRDGREERRVPSVTKLSPADLIQHSQTVRSAGLSRTSRVSVHVSTKKKELVPAGLGAAQRCGFVL